MKYRRFGRTGIKMPLISVGGMRFQTSWNGQDRINPESVKNLEKIVACALESGMNHIETAHGYGTSEEELGQVLPNFDRDSMILQTKVGPTRMVRKFLKTFKTSLQRLKVDRLDLFAIHGINNDDILRQVLRKGGILDAALKLKSDGVIGSLGFSTHGPASTILKAIQTDAFDYVNLWHSYIYPFNLGVINEANRRDMGVFIISPNDKGGMLFDPPEKLCRLTAPLSPMTFNDIHILSNPNIHTISCGAAKPTDFDEHIAAVEQMERLKDQVDTIRQRLDTELESIFGAEWAHTYLNGIPDCSQTPKGLNIPVIVWLWNLVKAFDLTKYAKMRYNLMGNADHWFPGCKPKTFAKMNRKKIRRSLTASPYADRIMDILEEAHELMTAEEVKRLSENE